MNRDEAKKLAKQTTGEQVRQMLINARSTITDWSLPSRPNAGISLGAAFNIFSKIDWPKYSTGDFSHVLIRTNAIWAFGEYLSDYFKPVKVKKNKPTVAFQAPLPLEETLLNVQ